MISTIALCLGAQAQVNNENMAAAVHDDGFGVSLSAGGAVIGGNLQMVDLRGSLAVQYRTSFPAREQDEQPWVRDRALINVTGNVLTVAGAPFLDQRLAHIGYNRMLTRRFGLEGAGQYQNNVLLLLEGRWTAAAGIRWIIARGKRGELSTGLAALLEHEVRNVDPEGPDARLVTNYRAVGRLTWRLEVIPDGLSWTHTIYAEPRIDDWRDHLIVDYNTLEAHVNKIVSVTGDLQLRYDSQPPTGVQPLDTRLTWGLRFRFAARPHHEQPHH